MLMSFYRFSFLFIPSFIALYYLFICFVRHGLPRDVLPLCLLFMSTLHMHTYNICVRMYVCRQMLPTHVYVFRV